MGTTQQTPNQTQAPTIVEHIISKMSVKALGCNPKVVSAKPETDKTPEKMCIIFGTASGIKSWEDKRNGQVYSALTGDFGGINLKTGEQYRSGKLFLPNGIHETIEAAVIGDGKGDQVVEFGLEIQAVRATNPIGYTYQAIPRIRATAADPLARLRQVIATQVQLPAPQATQPQLPQPVPQQLAAPAPAFVTEVGTVVSEAGAIAPQAPADTDQAQSAPQLVQHGQQGRGRRR